MKVGAPVRTGMGAATDLGLRARSLRGELHVDLGWAARACAAMAVADA